MEYEQLSITEWIGIKHELGQELTFQTRSFVKTGYLLRKISEQKLYEIDGHRSVTEFAKAEYGLSASVVSRFMAINARYSLDGFSDRIDPQYVGFSQSKLADMLMLPDADLQMITPEAERDDIRALKDFNRQDMQLELGQEPPADAGLLDVLQAFFEANADAAETALQEPTDMEAVKDAIVISGGSRSFRKGVYFLMFYREKIVIKKFGQEPEETTWDEIRKMIAYLIAEGRIRRQEKEPEGIEDEESTPEEDPEGVDSAEGPEQVRNEEPEQEPVEPEAAELKQETEDEEEEGEEDEEEAEAERNVQKPEQNVQRPEHSEQKTSENVQKPQKPVQSRWEQMRRMSAGDAAAYLYKHRDAWMGIVNLTQRDISTWLLEKE